MYLIEIKISGNREKCNVVFYVRTFFIIFWFSIIEFSISYFARRFVRRL